MSIDSVVDDMNLIEMVDSSSSCFEFEIRDGKGVTFPVLESLKDGNYKVYYYHLEKNHLHLEYIIKNRTFCGKLIEYSFYGDTIRIVNYPNCSIKKK